MATTTGVRQTILQDARRLGRWVGLRGLITLAFGALFLARPGTGVGLLVAVFGVYAFFDGFVALGAAITGAALRSRWALALQGVLSIGAGVLTFAMPGSMAVAILFLISARALIVGALEIIAAISLGQDVPSPWLLALNGVLSLLFGILLVRDPQAGLLTLSWLVGLYGVVIGGVELAAGFALSRAAKSTPPLRPVAQP
jgi:uncharacterized membrane protein HdeD (DUF308 family)